MFHISPSTREEFPSAISAASMLTSFTCRRDHKCTDKLKKKKNVNAKKHTGLK